MRNVAGLLAAAACLAASTIAAPAAGSEGVGEAKAVIDAATAAGQVGKRALAVGSAVYLGDEVRTDATGEAQLLFKDGTRMVVGPNASLVIDHFVFRAAAPENAFAVRALGGAFRFISGDQRPKEGYLIHTPSATIGVRGTAFDFTVGTADTSLVLLRGVATLCSGGACATVREVCGMARTDGGGVETVRNERLRVRETRRLFPYLVSQRGLAAGFRVSDRGCAADVAATTVDTDVAVASPPAADPPPAPEPEPAPPPGRGNNGIGNGGEPSQGEGTGPGSDPSNPGRGGGNGNAGGGGNAGGNGNAGGAGAGAAAGASDAGVSGGGGGGGRGTGDGNGRGGGNGNDSG